jgi:crotonobetainyl-CoA:carnitine CoA-transferase CaiB-like acyl-CoA transferase
VAANTGLLDGVRVLDLSVWRPGPYATQLLAEIGADVLKVEPPGGDPMRSYPELFASLNANKRSIVLDLKRDDDHVRVLGLAADADVVVEGFRPGVAARLGVSYDEVRAVAPSIVYCSVSGMGQSGPFRLVPGHDLNYQAWAGALAPEGGPPGVSKLPIADLAGGMAAAFAVCAAVVRCQRTGEGENIDTAMTDVLATWTGAAAPRTSNADASARGVPGYGLFATADRGHVTLGVLTENHFWTSLCAVLGLEDAAGLFFPERVARVEELQSRVAAAIALRERDELVDKLLAADVPVAPVLDRSEMLALPHLREREVATADPWADPAIGYPVRFARHPAARTAPPPGLDEHRGSGFLPRPEPPPNSGSPWPL